EQHGIDVVVSIYGQEGNLLTAVDRLNSTQGPETISLIAPSSGSYRLQIKSDQSPSVRGRYQDVFKEPRDAIPCADKLIGAEKLVLETGRLMAKNTAETLRQARTKFEIAAMLYEEAGAPYEAGLALYSAGVCSRL